MKIKICIKTYKKKSTNQKVQVKKTIYLRKKPKVNSKSILKKSST